MTVYAVAGGWYMVQGNDNTISHHQHLYLGVYRNILMGQDVAFFTRLHQAFLLTV
jgi:hypothetical protein